MRLARTTRTKRRSRALGERDPIEITRDYCTKHGIRLSDTWPIRPTEPLPNSGSREFPTLCWWELRAEWRRCGLDVWIRQAGTRCLHILANGRRRLLLSKVRLAATQPAALGAVSNVAKSCK